MLEEYKRPEYIKPKFQGDWTCEKCGKEVKELPFEPDPSRPIYCNECIWEIKKSRNKN